MRRHFQYGSRRIDYTLEFSDRKSLGITVTPEMEVLVKAPDGALLADIEVLLRKRAPWILKQLSYFLSFHPRISDKRFVSGESHLYLGRQYKLRVVEGTKNGVHFDGRQLILTRKPKSDPGKILSAWYRMKAKEQFSILAAPLEARFERYDVQVEGLFIQSMPTRWGSCTSLGKVILNPELIKAPKRCIEYVILHELCHLVHRNHTAAFFKLQASIMPDWEVWKDKLERLLA